MRNKIIYIGGSGGSGDVTLAGAQTFTGQKTFSLRPNVAVTNCGTDFATLTALVLNTDNRATLATNKTLTFGVSPVEGDSIFLKVLCTTAATLTFPSCKRTGAADSAITSLPVTTGNWIFHWRYIAGEWLLTDSVNNSRLKYTWSFNPKAVCDGTLDRLFLMTVGDDAPNGFVVTAWKLSFDADPATEIDLDLKRADAYIGVANAAVMDILDTTAGVSSESTVANINGGVAVANGKVMYLEFGTAYTTDNLQCIFELWGYAVN